MVLLSPVVMYTPASLPIAVLLAPVETAVNA